MGNAYTLEDRIIAFTLYRGKTIKEGIGLFSMQRIAELTGHSIASFQMKVDQFKGVAGCRKKRECHANFGPGLSEWAEMDELVWQTHKDTDIKALTEVAKKILKDLWSKR
jgi:hypothetical protein